MRALAILIVLVLPVHVAAQAAGEEAALRERIAAHERAPSRSIGGRGADGQLLPASEITLITVWRKMGTQWLVVSQRALPAPPRTPPA